MTQVLLWLLYDSNSNNIKWEHSKHEREKRTVTLLYNYPVHVRGKYKMLWINTNSNSWQKYYKYKYLLFSKNV